MKFAKSFSFLDTLSGLSLTALLALSLAGCGGGSASRDKASSSGDVLSVGFIYVGPKDDYGYNQAHAEGAGAVKKMSGVKVTEVENVLETVAVQKAMLSMIEQ